MRLTAQTLHRALLDAGHVVSEADAALAFVRLDTDDLRAEQEQRVRWERWDGESSIGTARPVDIRARADYGGGEVYLVYIDDQLVYLQPHAPGSLDVAPIAADDLVAIADEHCAAIVDEMVFEAALQVAMRSVPAPAAQPAAAPAIPGVFMVPPPTAPRLPGLPGA